MYRNQVRIRPLDVPEATSLPEGAGYHPATRTLNLVPEASQMGPGLPSWVRSMLETVL
jgi:hypothetical protein